MKESGNIQNKMYPVITIAVVVALWQMVVGLQYIQPYILPSPSNIIKTLVLDFRNIMENAETTLYESFVGFLYP